MAKDTPKADVKTGGGARMHQDPPEGTGLGDNKTLPPAAEAPPAKKAPKRSTTLQALRRVELALIAAPKAALPMIKLFVQQWSPEGDNIPQAVAPVVSPPPGGLAPLGSQS